MEDWPLYAWLGFLLVCLVLLVWYRAKHPVPYVPMTPEEEQDWMDDLLFPPYCCWDDQGDDDE